MILGAITAADLEAARDLLAVVRARGVNVVPMRSGIGGTRLNRLTADLAARMKRLSTALRAVLTAEIEAVCSTHKGGYRTRTRAVRGAGRLD